jgi:hypothetical protein
MFAVVLSRQGALMATLAPRPVILSITVLATRAFRGEKKPQEPTRAGLPDG